MWHVVDFERETDDALIFGDRPKEADFFKRQSITVNNFEVGLSPHSLTNWPHLFRVFSPSTYENKILMTKIDFMPFKN